MTFCARKHRGASQHLRIIKGADSESIARLYLRNDQLALPLFFTVVIERKVIMARATNRAFHFQLFTLISMIVEIETLNNVNIYFYSAHSKPPCCHSYANPAASIIRKTEDRGRSTDMFLLEAGIIGNSSAISKSNIKNSMATRKNRKEKGRRADFIGSKPHS